MTTKHFDYIANLISSAKQRADSLSSGIGHHGIEGEIREIATRNCVEPFLTQSYQCGTGKILDSLQNLSDQIDLVIYHKKVAPPILINRDLGLYPVECVRYVFEVKATLTASEVKDANKKFRSVTKLNSFPVKQADGSIRGRRSPSTVLLAFRSDISGSEIERYKKHTPEDIPPCTVLCVLGKGYWFYDSKTKGWYGQEALSTHPEYMEFCLFIAGFMNTLAEEEMKMEPFLPGNYILRENVLARPINESPTKQTDHVDESAGGGFVP